MELDLTTENGVKTLMATSKNESEWNANCDKVKAANNGTYPDFWYKAVILSGLSRITAAGWL